MRTLIRLRPGLWPLVAINSVAIVATFIVLAASPAPVHFPSTHWEALMLAGAAAVIVVANVMLLGAAVARSVERGRRAKTQTPRLAQLRRTEHFHVDSDGAAIGIVDEVIGDRHGEAEVLIVASGWFGATRFYVPVEAVSAVDERRRVVRIGEARPEEGAPR